MAKTVKERKKRDMRVIFANILFFTLVASVIFSVVRWIQAPADGVADVRGRFRSDYMLMAVQCALGTVVMLLPTFIRKKWSINIPNFIYILYYIFLYCGIFLGEVFSFFYRVPNWDSILHAFSGAMLGALGFILVDVLNNTKGIDVHLSPFFVSLFAFSFALSIGAVWEIYEFSLDGLLGLNMQKYMTAAGESLVGRAALRDTMKDIILDALAALGVAVAGYFSIKKKKLNIEEIIEKEFAPEQDA